MNEVSSLDYVRHCITKMALEDFLHTNFFGNPLLIFVQKTLESMLYIFKMKISF